MAQIVSVQPVRSEGVCRFDVTIRTDTGKELHVNVSSEQILDHERFQRAVLDEWGCAVRFVANGAEAAARAQWIEAVGAARWPAG